MNVKRISDNIAWDGKSYFCLHCARSGYKSLAAVKGHLAMCPGKAMQKGAIPEPQPPGQPAAASPSLAGYPNFRPSMAMASHQLQQQQSHDYRQLEARITQMENEYNHMLQIRNAPTGGNWMQDNLAWVVIGAIVLIAMFLYGGGQRCPSPVSGSPSNSGSSPDFSKLGEKLVGKAADRAITKSVDKVFG